MNFKINLIFFGKIIYYDIAFLDYSNIFINHEIYNNFYLIFCENVFNVFNFK